jgi:hypothetical protein
VHKPGDGLGTNQVWRRTPAAGHLLDAVDVQLARRVVGSSRMPPAVLPTGGTRAVTSFNVTLPGALLGSSSRSSTDRFGHNRACASPEHTRQTASTPTRDSPPSSAALTTAVLGTWSRLRLIGWKAPGQPRQHSTPGRGADVAPRR